MSTKTKENSTAKLKLENQNLRLRLAEAEDAINAIRNGEIDAIVVQGEHGNQIFTLTSAETPYRVMIEQMEEGAATVIENGTVLYCNQKFAEFVDQPPEKVMGSNIFNFFDDTEKEKLSVLLNNGMDKSCQGEICISKKEAVRCFQLSFSPIINPDSRKVCCIISNEFTQIKNKENELRESEAQFRETVNVSPVPLALVDNNLQITYLNPAFVETFGYTVDDIPNLDIGVLKALPDPKYRETVFNEWKQSLENSLLNGSSFQPVEFNVKCKNNSFKTVLGGSTTFSDSSRIGRLIVLFDITDRKRAENEIGDKNKELDKLISEKNKFFSIIAHDLKSPFNSIVGFSELLVSNIKEGDFDNIEKYAEIILHSSEHAMELVANLMEWAQSQTGRLKVVPEGIDIIALLDNLISQIENTALQKSITIHKVLPEKCFIHADKKMLSTVLRNLISNAIKYTHAKGKINVEIRKNKEETIFIVSDNGVGISPDIVEKLFRIENSVSAPGTANETGTGLGLVLCREFVEKHNGKIWVESALGMGSSFYFSIPNHNS